MKKIILAALVALAAVIGVSAAANSSKAEPVSDATVEYVIPHITSGSMQLQHFHKLFDLMPYDIQQQAIMAYNDIVTDIRSEFVYGGIRVKHTDTTWEFYYKGGSIIVRNATSAELLNIFRAPAI
jgi:hypothetical protein